MRRRTHDRPLIRVHIQEKSLLREREREREKEKEREREREKEKENPITTLMNRSLRSTDNHNSFLCLLMLLPSVYFCLFLSLSLSLSLSVLLAFCFPCLFNSLSPPP